MYDLTHTLLVTLKVAASALALVALPAVALGHALARREFVGKSLVEAIVSLPLVLPPTAVGYLLLDLLAYDGWLGQKRLGFDLGLVLTWKGAAVASAVMASPLVVRTSRVAFESVDPRLEGVSRTLGLGPFETFLRVTLPLASRGVLAALVLGFARALGEFGATIIVAGNLDETRTLALAIFGAEQAGRSGEARVFMGIALGIGFAAVAITEALSRRGPSGARGKQP
jgi:molybdate transport system permease protein